MKLFWTVIVVLSIGTVAYFWSAGPHRIRAQTTAAATGPSGDLVTAGKTISIDEDVAGDVAAAGNNVTVSAPVGGYVMGAGATVTVDGSVGDDLWAAGRTVRVNSPVHDSIWAAGRRVVLDAGSTTGGDAHLAGASVEVRGRIGRDLSVGADRVVLASEVDGSVHASADQVHVEPPAVIHGDLVVSGPHAPDIAPGANVMGQIVHQPSQGRRGAITNWLMTWAWLFLGVFMVGVAALALSRDWVTRVSDRLSQRTGISFAVGALVAVVVPLLAALVALTVIGIPLSVAVAALYLLAAVLSSMFVSFQTGGWLLERWHRSAPAYARLALGTLVVSFLATLPSIGWICLLILMVFGMGALVLDGRESLQIA